MRDIRIAQFDESEYRGDMVPRPPSFEQQWDDGRADGIVSIAADSYERRHVRRMARLREHYAAIDPTTVITPTKRVRCVTTGVVYESACEAADAYGISGQRAREVAKVRGVSMGVRWEYVGGGK